MRGWFGRLHVYVQLALVCLLSALMLLVYFGAYARRASDSARATLAEYGKSMMEQLTQTVDTNYVSYSKILRLISFDKDVQAFLLNDDDALRVDLHSALKRALIEVATLSGSITDIVVEDAKGRMYNLADSLLTLPALTHADNGIALSGRIHRATGGAGAGYLVMGKGIYSIDSYNQTNQLIGSAYLILSSDAFASEARADDSAVTALFLTDGEGAVLWSNTADASQEMLDAARAEPDKMYYFAETPLARTGYRVFALQKQPESLFPAQRLGDMGVLAALILPLILLWVFWARNLVRPLTKFRRFINRLRGGTLSELGSVVTLTGYREAEVIGSEFNALLQKTRLLTEELVRANSDLYESKLLVKQSELSNLRSQINPHFLYNTLETMVGIAYTNHQPELAAIARSLSLIFKFSIKGGGIVPLKTEWKIVQSYIDIQHYRFSDRFSVRYALAPECGELFVPKLILQPMIENAIVHGIEQTDGFCHLSVEAALDGGVLTLRVTDDGAGIDPGTLAELNEKLKDGRAPADGTHIGILNVDSRIKLQYGREYGVTLESEKGRGTIVTLTLPARREADDV